MPALINLTSASLAWKKTGGTGPTFSLEAREGTAATLAFLPEDSTLARVETSSGAWTLKHSHFPASSVTLRQAGSKTDLAIFHPHLVGNGKLVFQGDETFDWVRIGGIHPGAAFLDADGLPLVQLTVNPDGTSGSAPENTPLALVDISQPHRRLADPALLSAIGWYLLQLETLLEDSGVAAETSLRM